MKYSNLFGAILITTTTLVAFAEEAQLNATPEKPKWSWDGQLPVDVIATPGAEKSSQIRMQDFEIKVNREISENIRASVKFKLDRALYENGSFLPQTFNFEDFIKEAKIEVRNIGGKPVALVIGKQEMAFGVDTTKMPIPPESPVHNLVVQNEVIGFTVALEQDFNLFDKVELSGFETKAGDLQIGTFDGAAVRISKNITEQIKVAVSAMHLGNGYDKTLGSENRQSVGLVFKSKDENYELWTEAVRFDNNQLYKNSRSAISVGGARKFGPGSVTVEATLVPGSLRQIGIGYNLELRKNLYVGVEVRGTQYDPITGMQSVTQVGSRIKYLFEGRR